MYTLARKPRGDLLPSIVATGLLAVLLSWGPLSQAKDSYLDSIDAEADDLTVDSAVSLDASDAQHGAEPKGIPDDLDLSGFEDLLRSRYIGSYMFYNKLSDGDRSAVYDEYMSSKNIELIRKKIISLFSSN